MTLFDGDSHQTTPVKKSAPERRRSVGITLLISSLVLVVGLAAVPTGFVIEQPGPAFDTLGEVEVPAADDQESPDKIPLISITGAPTFDTTGALDLLTVSVLGNPDITPSWVEVASAWFDPSRAVMPLESIYPKDETAQERDKVNAAQMVDSQQDAIAAALTHLGYDVIVGVSVESFTAESPAKTSLAEGDVITAVNAVPVNSVPELRDQLASNGTDAPATISFIRQGEQLEADITPIEVDGHVVLGVGAKTAYDFPFDITVHLDDVGGPSAGLMFSLGIIDKLTPENETGGLHIAGTGTIDAAGTVGPIGGITQKLYGAKNAGATIALVPTENCAEAKGHVPEGLETYSVATLDEALAVLKFVRMHGDLASAMNAHSGMFATCNN